MHFASLAVVTGGVFVLGLYAGVYLNRWWYNQCVIHNTCCPVCLQSQDAEHRLNQLEADLMVDERDGQE